MSRRSSPRFNPSRLFKTSDKIHFECDFVNTTSDGCSARLERGILPSLLKGIPMKASNVTRGLLWVAYATLVAAWYEPLSVRTGVFL